ncbi:MAG: hypothetical protein ABIE92_12215 [bacterium]
MKYLIPCLLLLAMVGVSHAEEITANINVSLVDPYSHVVPGFNISLRPEFADFGRFSFGAGFGMHISNRINYYNSNWIEFVPSDTTYDTDTTDWFYFDEEFIDLIHYEIFLDARYRVLGRSEEDKWKGYLSINLGFVSNAGKQSLKETVAGQHKDELNIITSNVFAYNFQTEYENSIYLSPGIQVGVNSFIFGYRHWILFNNRDLIDGKPAQMIGTANLGYRFSW